MFFSQSGHRITFISIMFFLTVFYTYPLHAEPEQRLIIHFDKELTESHHNEIGKLLHNLIRTEFTLAKHSNSLRWIVILQNRLNPEKIGQLKSELLKDKRIKEVELDTVLNKTTLIQAQLLPL